MEWYERHYKQLFLIPWIILLLAIAVIVYTSASTGDFVHKGVTLKGGVSATAELSEMTSATEIEDVLRSAFPQADITVRGLNTFGTTTSYIIDAADIHPDADEAAKQLGDQLEAEYTVSNLTTETTGPSLGDAFFIQTIIGILLAFLWMGWVVFLYFGKQNSIKAIMGLLTVAASLFVAKGVIGGTVGATVLGAIVLASMIAYFFFSIPSGAVILAAASTITFTLATINLLGIRLSTAGVAAFLMLIGYSVDTDILLSTRTIKEHNKPIFERIKGAFKTGITMQLTTTAAVLAAFLLTTSEVIRQIMLIILIGMVADIIFTWLQNAGIIYWYLQRGEKK